MAAHARVDIARTGIDAAGEVIGRGEAGALGNATTCALRAPC